MVWNVSKKKKDLLTWAEVSQESAFAKYELTKNYPWYFVVFAKHGSMHQKLAQKS